MINILWLSLLAGGATVLGGFVACLLPRRDGIVSFFLGQAAGIMLAVTFFELYPAAISISGDFAAWSGIFGGLLLMVVLDSFMTRKIGQRGGRGLVQAGVLIALGIALHDLPEGAAISAGFAAMESLGLIMAAAIGLHNLPEGIAVAVPLLSAGKKPAQVLLLLALISLCTPLGALAGIYFSRLLSYWLGGLLGAAAGAMLYISLKELIPQAVGKGRGTALFGVLSGLAIFFIVRAAGV